MVPKFSETFTIGSVHVAALSDGAPDWPLPAFFHGIDATEWTQAVGLTDPNQPVPFNFGAFLLRDGERTVLVDSGVGPAGRDSGYPGGGELPERLADLGLGRDEIDIVAHTHLHWDHCGWNTSGDGESTEMTFPNATIVLAAKELEYWLHPALNENEQTPMARRAILPALEAGRVVTFDGEYTIAPGITAVPTPGHTPGHVSIMLASQREHLLILGDAAHHPVHFEHHDWVAAVDVDPAESTRSRLKLSELAVEHDALVTSAHFPILTLGRIRRVERGYRWESAAPVSA